MSDIEPRTPKALADPPPLTLQATITALADMPYSYRSRAVTRLAGAIEAAATGDWVRAKHLLDLVREVIES